MIIALQGCYFRKFFARSTSNSHDRAMHPFEVSSGAVTIDGIGASALTDYAGICGLLLAKSHARTSGASMIAGYLGRSDKADRALCRFARRYAEQTERDYQALLAAVAHGLLHAETAQ
jgi:hypothetical protein